MALYGNLGWEAKCVFEDLNKTLQVVQTGADSIDIMSPAYVHGLDLLKPIYLCYCVEF